MLYAKAATAATPMLIIYLIDTSDSMRDPLASADGKTKIAVVQEAFEAILGEMVSRSTKGDIVSPRYAIHLFTYGADVKDVYGKTISISEAVDKPTPQFRAGGGTNTSAAFEAACKVLRDKMPHLQNCPAPMICHLTDGEFSPGCSPQAIIKDILKFRNEDGPVLIENIFVGEQLLDKPILDIQQWEGVRNSSELAASAMRFLLPLYEMSSPMPASYAANLKNTYGYNLKEQAKMLIPATSIDLVELAFAVSAATNTR